MNFGRVIAIAMLESNIPLVLKKIKPGDKVLDIGGWAGPLHRADYIMDMGDYESRRFHAAHAAGMPEHFTKETWIQRDICDREPYPFKDKELDFVLCSHTLEDIRDPLWVCSEMARISKAGYIEVPSRLAETCRGVNRECPVGYHHHRWLVEIAGNEIFFRVKDPIISNHWSLSFPRKFWWSLSREQKVTFLFWEKNFKWSEVFLIDRDEIRAEMKAFVERYFEYPAWKFKAEATVKRVRQMRRDAKDLISGRKE